MLSEDVRHSQSAISFNVIKKRGKYQHKNQLKDFQKTQNIQHQKTDE